MITFYVLAFLSVYGAVQAVLRKNPVTCALHLALSMVAIAGLFFHLGALFIAGVQLAVYAGAVTVLFVMIVMLFDHTEEVKISSVQTRPYAFLKAFFCVFIFGLLAGHIPHSVGVLNKILDPERVKTIELSKFLFSKYVLLFEWLGWLLLIVAVGVVILSRGVKSDFDH